MEACVHRLKQTMQTLHPTVPRTRHRPSYIPPDLATCTHVFVRHDAVRKPLRPPYDGPFRVVSRTDKYFTLDLNGRQDTVSIDRLKVAHIEPTTIPRPPPSDPPDPPTRNPVPMQHWSRCLYAVTLLVS